MTLVTFETFDASDNMTSTANQPTYLPSNLSASESTHKRLVTLETFDQSGGIDLANKKTNKKTVSEHPQRETDYISTN